MVRGYGVALHQSAELSSLPSSQGENVLGLKTLIMGYNILCSKVIRAQIAPLGLFISCFLHVLTHLLLLAPTSPYPFPPSSLFLITLSPGFPLDWFDLCFHVSFFYFLFWFPIIILYLVTALILLKLLIFALIFLSHFIFLTSDLLL